MRCVNLNPQFAGAKCFGLQQCRWRRRNFCRAVRTNLPPRTGPNSECDSTDTSSSFDAELGSEFTFDIWQTIRVLAKPFHCRAGLRAKRSIALIPCTPNPDNTTFLVPKQPDRVLRNCGRSQSHHEGKQRRYRFVLGGHLQHAACCAQRQRHHAGRQRHLSAGRLHSI